MICLVTRFTSRTSGLPMEGGHMAWHDPNEALAYARSIWGVDAVTNRQRFGIELAVCEYPDTCPVQDGIRLGLYEHVVRIPERTHHAE